MANSGRLNEKKISIYYIFEEVNNGRITSITQLLVEPNPDNKVFFLHPFPEMETFILGPSPFGFM